MQLKNFIDHTNLKPTATPAEIQELCKEAKTYGFKAVCVNGCHVGLAKESLKGSEVKLAAVIGFPLGAMSTEAKVFEAKNCIEHGADEIDMVINIGWLKSNMDDLVREEIAEIKRAIGDKLLKVILETCFLSEEEKKRACILSVEANADFVKTSTGFGSGGATFEDVALMKKMVAGKAKIKASGGVRDKETAIKYIELGVERIGTSSGPSLVK
ncbi:deoxyribose-phosphate aldolase [Flagellimonas nanhaiensis]|uniref:Deoxyribose-phosphate aldolase n=1 Tax=Flagellimonas nanhaiensis TaxID=2292706 RepID=A0A371JMT6_9FLAO|nr:deoxyribose-phosphate aldolase [Allomuricauda nanhaiensis]RDY58451.1 deoxyribose-phosphate aldolase [Allomuricauda nanhaiensis]